MSRIMCAKQVSVSELRNLEDPKRLTPTHYPLRFDVCHDLLRGAIEEMGFRITGEEIGLSDDGLRAVGIIDLDDFGTDGAQTLFSWHNAHDMSWGQHFNAGDINRVCANMQTYGNSVRVSRKNTKYAGRDLPRLVYGAVSKLVEYRQLHNKRVECYMQTELSKAEGDSLIITALKSRIIGRDDVLRVHEEWHNPRHWEFAMRRNAHRLLQAFTETWKEDDGRVNFTKLAGRSQALHGILDGVCNVLS